MVANCLTREGFVVWWDAAIHSGESFDLVIERQLAEAKAVVVLWSPNSVNSRWVRAEAASADRSGKLAPVTIEPCIRPIIFELMHTVDLSHWHGDTADTAWEQFLLDLHRIARLNGQSAGDASPDVPAPAAHSGPRLTASPPDPVAASTADRSAFAGFKPAAVTLDESEDDEQYEATQFTAFEPAPEQPEHFLCMIVDGRAEKQFPVNEAALRIGRSAPAEVVLIDKLVSRRHCRVELRNDELIVVDLGSTNGTFVDNEKVEAQTVLPVGSVLKIGECQLVHELHWASARV